MKPVGFEPTPEDCGSVILIFLMKEMLIYAYLQFPSSSLFLSIKSVLPIVNQSSISFNDEPTRARELARELTNSHMSTRLVDHRPHPIIPKKSTSPRTLRTKSLLRCFLVTLTRSNNQIVCAATKGLGKPIVETEADADSLILPYGPLCPADFA